MLGPIAVGRDLQGRGIGSLMLDFAEELHPVTQVDVVSCRTDLEKFYNHKGYKLVREVPIHQVEDQEFRHLTRNDLTVKYLMKQNY